MTIEPAPPEAPWLVLQEHQWETVLAAVLGAPEMLRDTERHMAGLPALVSLPMGAWPPLEWMVRHSCEGEATRIAPVVGLQVDGRAVAALAPANVPAINDPTYLDEYPSYWVVDVRVRKHIQAR